MRPSGRGQRGPCWRRRQGDVDRHGDGALAPHAELAVLEPRLEVDEPLLLEHLDGERAGFINKPFDLKFMRSLVDDPEWATQFSIAELVEQTGTQGVELVMWLAMRAALGQDVRQVTSNYHIPISNTASGLMLLEPV